MQETKWVCGWGTSTSRTAYQLADSFEDTTFRYVILPTISGTKIRLRLSNYYGKNAAILNCAYAASYISGAKTDACDTVKITFGGKDEAVLSPGAEIVSDEIDFSVTPGKSIAVSLYFKERTDLCSGHSNNGVYIEKYFAKGNFAASPELPAESLSGCPLYAYIHGLDILTDKDTKAIIALGDSITAQPWPDCLSRRLLSLGITNRSVIRKGIGGNRLLREYTTFRPRIHQGISVLKRFERDILQPGVDRVFMLIGINDLLHPGSCQFAPMSELPTAEELIEGYKTCIDIAHRHNIKIYISTILPCGRFLANGMEERDMIRSKVNSWLRSTDLMDGLLDFESALWDESEHRKLRAEYDSGDLLHPSLAGAQAIADSIPVEYLQ